jgi:hypothetical protein
VMMGAPLPPSMTSSALRSDRSLEMDAMRRRRLQTCKNARGDPVLFGASTNILTSITVTFHSIFHFFTFSLFHFALSLLKREPSSNEPKR